MMANNIVFIIVILIIVGIIVYFYFNYRNRHNPSDNTISFATNKNNSKRVRFDRNAKLHNNKRALLSLSPNMMEESDGELSAGDLSANTSLGSSTSYSEKSSISQSEKSEISSLENSHWAAHNEIEPEKTWDCNFGLPLMSKEQKQKFVSKMQKNYKNYQKSLGQFSAYQTDNKTLIHSETKIDPFSNQQKLIGRPIKDIYDEQVSGPKAIPKKIKHRTESMVVYADENEMNGGNIKGTKLRGYDSTSSKYKSASFGDDFCTNN